MPGIKESIGLNTTVVPIGISNSSLNIFDSPACQDPDPNQENIFPFLFPFWYLKLDIFPTKASSPPLGDVIQLENWDWPEI